MPFRPPPEPLSDGALLHRHPVAWGLVQIARAQSDGVWRGPMTALYAKLSAIVPDSVKVGAAWPRSVRRLRPFVEGNFGLLEDAGVSIREDYRQRGFFHLYNGSAPTFVRRRTSREMRRDVQEMLWLTISRHLPPPPWAVSRPAFDSMLRSAVPAERQPLLDRAEFQAEMTSTLTTVRWMLKRSCGLIFTVTDDQVALERVPPKLS